MAKEIHPVLDPTCVDPLTGAPVGGLEQWLLPDGQLLTRTHPAGSCQGANCVLHRPLIGPWSTWFLTWRDTEGFFERVCECGIGHPDPSQFDQWRRTGQMFRMLHGCCLPHLCGPHRY